MTPTIQYYIASLLEMCPLSVKFQLFRYVGLMGFTMKRGFRSVCSTLNNDNKWKQMNGHVLEILPHYMIPDEGKVRKIVKKVWKYFSVYKDFSK